MTKEQAQKEVERLNKLHTGEWITMEDVKDYQERAKDLPELGRQDIGERRRLREELQERFGIDSYEALMIINGYGGVDTVNKYERIKNLQPLVNCDNAGRSIREYDEMVTYMEKKLEELRMYRDDMELYEQLKYSG